MAEAPGSSGPLVIGSGIAGLYVALRARELGRHPVIVTKSRLEESNTRYAQGGIAAAIGADDSAALHLRDTVRAGAGLVDRAAAARLTEEGPARIADLVRFGVPFDTVDGRIALGREAAHSRSRIVHAGGDATGLQIEETLRQRVADAGIDARERTILRRLETGPGGFPRVTLSRADGSAVEVSEGRPVVLATGGAGSLYRETTNPSVTTGEGVALAWRAGAWVRDMEFIQFHPTALAVPGSPRHLITEALRGEGAVLTNAAGDRFMTRYHPDGEMAPRDVASRAIAAELARTGERCVYLDATRLPAAVLDTRFPTIRRMLSAYGIDPSRDRIPVTPVAHFMIGGVATDLDGRTSLAGLFACGEVASTGVHGANRLASNSLLEGLVFGERVVAALDRPGGDGPRRPRRRLHVAPIVGTGPHDATAVIERVRDLLWQHVGIVRNGVTLAQTASELERLAAQLDPDADDSLATSEANAVATARLITRAALARVESRGAHYRTDFPLSVAGWRTHLGIRATPS